MTNLTDLQFAALAMLATLLIIVFISTRPSCNDRDEEER